MSNLQALLSVAQIQMVQAEEKERGSNFRVAQRYIVEMTYKTIGVVDPQADVNDHIKVMEKFKEWCDKEGFLMASEVCQECLKNEKSVGYLADAYSYKHLQSKLIVKKFKVCYTPTVFRVMEIK